MLMSVNVSYIVHSTKNCNRENVRPNFDLNPRRASQIVSWISQKKTDKISNNTSMRHCVIVMLLLCDVHQKLSFKLSDIHSTCRISMSWRWRYAPMSCVPYSSQLAPNWY